MSSQSEGYRWGEEKFLFSVLKAISLGMRRSYCLSGVMGTANFLNHFFFFFLLICGGGVDIVVFGV